MCPSMSPWALAGSQSTVSDSAPTVRPLASITEWAPRLKSVALLSVGEPLIITIVPSPLPWRSSSATRASPCSTPTRSLSNEM